MALAMRAWPISHENEFFCAIYFILAGWKPTNAMPAGIHSYRLFGSKKAHFFSVGSGP